jgi:hypothetical protein
MSKIESDRASLQVGRSAASDFEALRKLLQRLLLGRRVGVDRESLERYEPRLGRFRIERHGMAAGAIRVRLLAVLHAAPWVELIDRLPRR